MGGGYSAWVDSCLAGDKPPEELKTACKFRPWNADWYTLFVCRSQSICMCVITVKFNGFDFEQRRKMRQRIKEFSVWLFGKLYCMITVWDTTKFISFLFLYYKNACINNGCQIQKT